VPKQVDHEQRRVELIDALFRIAARDGLAAASIRAVAAEAGVPAPQVQYYFGNKALLLSGALELLGRRVVQRGLALMNEAGDDPPPEALLRAALTGSHPIDDESRHNLVLFFCFYVAALTEPSMSETGLLVSQRWITQYFASLIREAQERGETPTEIDPDNEARLILFANTGLILGALAGAHSLDEATSALDYHLRRVFPPRSRATRKQTRRR
jgi:AcrR family transcriptional regulator